MKFDCEKKGLLTVFKPYQVEALKLVYENPEGYGSGKIWELCNERLPSPISRASYIFFSNDMVDDKVFTFRDRTGKGGHHRIYTPAFPTLGECLEYLRKKIIESVQSELKV